jgi:hypothetical protein
MPNNIPVEIETAILDIQNTAVTAIRHIMATESNYQLYNAALFAGLSVMCWFTANDLWLAGAPWARCGLGGLLLAGVAANNWYWHRMHREAVRQIDGELAKHKNKNKKQR